MNAEYQAFDNDKLDVIETQLNKLVCSIQVANDIADGKGSLTDYSDPERKLLAEQFAQATGILSCCAAIAEDENKPPSTIKMYDTYSKVFTELSYKAGLISGAFADPDKMLEHLKKLGGQVGEYMHHYHIDPVKLHAAAMGMVEGEFDEPEEKPKKFWT